MAYTTVDGTVLWKGKPARFSKGAIGRRLDDGFATDGRALFFAQQRIETPPGVTLNPESLTVRRLRPGLVNLPPTVLSDPESVWFVNPADDGQRFTRLAGADAATVARMPATRVYRDHHVRDHAHVWYRGRRLDGIRAEQAVVLGENLCTDGSALWISGVRSPDLRAADVTRIWSAHGSDLVRTDGALLSFAPDQPSGIAHGISDASAADTTPSEAMHAIARDLFGLFVSHPQIVTAVDDIDWARAAAVPLPAFLMALHGDGMVIYAEGVALVRARADAWYGALCTLWLRWRGWPDGVVTYPSLGIMQSDGMELRERLIRRHAAAYLRFAGAVHRSGDHAAAHLLLHAFVSTYWHGQATPYDGLFDVVAQLPRTLFADSIYASRRDAMTATTNLAAAREAITAGLLADADPRVRREMLCVVHATVLASDKVKQFVQHVLPAILERRSVEPVPSVAEQIDQVVDAFIIAGMVQAEVGSTFLPDTMEELIREQVRRGVNVLLNRARLIEVLLQQDRFAEADVCEASFISDFGAACAVPGLYAHRPVYRSVALAVLHMSVRAAMRSGDAETIAARSARIHDRVNRVRAEIGGTLEDGADWRAISADLDRCRDEFGVARKW